MDGGTGTHPTQRIDEAVGSQNAQVQSDRPGSGVRVHVPTERAAESTVQGAKSLSIPVVPNACFALVGGCAVENHHTRTSPTDRPGVGEKQLPCDEDIVARGCDRGTRVLKIGRKG